MGKLPNLLEQKELRDLYMKEVEKARSKYSNANEHYKLIYNKSDLKMSQIPLEEFSDQIKGQNLADVLRLRGYAMGKRIGHGGYGQVFSGSSPAGDLAIKSIEIPKNVPSKKYERTLQKLFLEIAVMERYPHPNIVTLVDHFMLDDIAYLVMELAPCGSLESFLIKSGTFNEMDSYEYFIQMLRGLLYLHTFSIAHRDIKLDNVLLWNPLEGSRIRVAKLTDFGLSQAVYKSQEGRIIAGYYAGTRHYMAPEIIKLEVFTEFNISDHMDFNPFKADIFAMGVCLYEMLTAKTPFNYGRNFKKTYEAQMKMNYSYPSGINCGPEVRDLIAKMLESDPDKRLDPFGIWTHPWMLFCYRTHRIHNHPLSPWRKVESLKSVPRTTIKGNDSERMSRTSKTRAENSSLETGKPCESSKLNFRSVPTASAISGMS